jgi:hypothetical protein
MATLITAENPGRWKRRCDATCHRATKPQCACSCNGRYHGKGDVVAKLQHDLYFKLMTDALEQGILFHSVVEAELRR